MISTKPYIAKVVRLISTFMKNPAREN